MQFVSYAQNYEDVLLWRALGDIPDGRYIDIGAQDPVVDSVSKVFHLRGWKGVHVDANPVYIDALKQDRPEDEVIQAAVGRSPEPMTFYSIPGTGLSTGVASIADHHRENGFQVQATTVPVMTLAAILEPFATADVHWLKIDVEGMEADVVASWGDCAVRPWILVIEATYPNTQVPTEGAWINMVLSRGYQEVHFDGLSRYFVSREHAERASAFETSPNIFDAFAVTKHHFSASEICRLHSEQIDQLKQTLGNVRTAYDRLLHDNQEMRTEQLNLTGMVKKLSSANKRTTRILKEGSQDKKQQSPRLSSDQELEHLRTLLSRAQTALAPKVSK